MKLADIKLSFRHGAETQLKRAIFDCFGSGFTDNEIVEICCSTIADVMGDEKGNSEDLPVDEGTSEDY